MPSISPSSETHRAPLGDAAEAHQGHREDAAVERGVRTREVEQELAAGDVRRLAAGQQPVTCSRWGPPWAVSANAMPSASPAVPGRRTIRTLTGFFGGDWLRLLRYLEEAPHPDEEIVAAIPQTKLFVGGKKTQWPLIAR
ncbi:MAG: hypothetical protein QOE87_4573 [Gaiellales bacterium]|nr:hypothetical protein [Gaiellales bacterium]